MSVSLRKGGSVSFTPAAPDLTAVTVALGWQVRASTGAHDDMAASALALAADTQIPDDHYSILFNNLRSILG